MLTAAKTAGVRIDLVNLMTMYFSTKKVVMATACLGAAAASQSFVVGLGAKLGVTPQIGKNPDKPYTVENFTLSDATILTARLKALGYVTRLAFWELSADTAKYGGQYSKIMRAFT